MKKVIVFNGPPGCGKDTAAEVVEDVAHARHCRFKDRLYELTADILGVELGVFKELAIDRNTKEQPMFIMRGERVSPRDAMIVVSEVMLKPIMGRDYFALAAVAMLNKSEKTRFVFSDGGFAEEVNALAETGAEVTVVRLHRDGCSFEGDSRSYLDADMFDLTRVRVEFVDMISGELEEFKQTVAAFAKEYF